MAIDKAKIKVTLPEGLTQKGEISVDEAKKTATVVVTGKTVGQHTVSVTYNGGAAKTTNVTVTAAPAFSGDPTASPASIHIGEESVISQAFTVDGIQPSEVTVTVPEGLTKKGEHTISGKSLSLTVTGKTAGAHEVQLQFKGVTKKVTVNVTEVPPAFSGEPVADPATVKVGADVTVTQEFTKAGVVASEVVLTPSAGLTLKTPASVSGTTFTVVYTAKTAGAQTVKLEYKGASKTASVTVEDLVVTLSGVTANPTSVVQGQDSTITMQFAEN